MRYSMPCLSVLLSLLVFSTPILSSPLFFDRRLCQAPTPDPLIGCPPNTFLVGPANTSAPYHTVQSAILAFESSIPQTKTASQIPGTILVLPGLYPEQINITTPRALTLLGQTSCPNNASSNLVTIRYDQATGNAVHTFDNAYTSVLTVAPTLNSSLTGSGPTGNSVPANTPFGNRDFRVYNIDFVNGYAPYSAGPALAVSVSYANAGFYYSGFYSYQDTVYIGKLGNAFFGSSIIAGQTDFLYGFGTTWIDNSVLKLRSCGGGITAWKGTNTTFENKYGVYIHDSQLLKANSSLQITGKCALGRPWNAGHRSVFANCFFDDSVKPAGYIVWSATDPHLGANTTMATYADYGPGYNVTAEKQSNLTIVMTDEQYAPYASPELVFQQPFSGTFGNTAWIDKSPQAWGGL